MENTLVRIFRIGVALLTAAALLAPTSALAVPAICRVDVDATGENNGKSWPNAFTSLHSALNTSLCDQVWVAEGVYAPSTSEVGAFFLIPAGLAVYGGFEGIEDSLDDRDWREHVTILSGDMTGNDTNTDGNRIAETPADIQASNSDSVVYLSGYYGAITSTTVLDGFFITAADGNDGSGLYCDAFVAPGLLCSPTLAHLVFSGNRASISGAGMMLRAEQGGDSSPTLTDVTFTGNSAVYGAGLSIYADHGTSNPKLSGVTFRDNHATTLGGGIRNYGRGPDASASPTLSNVTFDNNSAWLGGAMSNRGYTDGGLPKVAPDLRNVTFHANSAELGGGLFNDGQGGVVVQLTNAIMWGDAATTAGDEIYNEYVSMVWADISHSVVEGSGGSGAAWDDDLGTDSGGNLDADPRLIALANNGGYTKTMALGPGSSAIDAGNDTVCAGFPVSGLDQRGATRPFDGDEDGTSHCDMGAYELVLFHVSGNAGAADARLDYDWDGPRFVMSDDAGEYSLPVPGPWVGTVTPLKNDTIFTPPSRTYKVTADITGQDYAAVFVPPEVTQTYPVISPACRTPKVGARLSLRDVLRSASGNLDTTKITLRLDGVLVTPQLISHDAAAPPSAANIVYTPSGNLSLGLHNASLDYADGEDGSTHNWSFTVTSMVCPTSAPADMPAIALDAPAVPGPLTVVAAQTPVSIAAGPPMQNAYRRLMLVR